MEPGRSNLRIADLDSGDKPREKALNIGVEHLTNAELIAIILGSGLPGKSVIDLSRDILRDSDNKLSVLSRLSVHELTTKFNGIGPAKAISLMAAIELGSRCVHSLSSEIVEPVVTSSKIIYDYIRQRLERRNHEEFWIVFLDRSNRIKSSEMISVGGVSGTIVDIKIILKKALDKLASSLILVHNHPSGNLKPSVADDSITSKIKEGAEAIDMKVLDHIIVSPLGYYSYNDEGRL
ncbi:MAG: DNA repair protein RadC [Muribaculaceae bacterium]|nr:DNA repair protein RadC [Muribaculaceae bacterium]